MLLMLWTALAASDGEQCASGDPAACEAMIARERAIQSAYIEAGRTPPWWRSRALMAPLTQLLALGEQAGTPLVSGDIVVKTLCGVGRAPACPAVPKPIRPVQPTEPETWRPWDASMITDARWHGDRYIAAGHSPGVVRWASSDGRLVRRASIARPVCAGPVVAGDAVFVATGAPRAPGMGSYKDEGETSCRRLHRFSLDTGELLETRDLGQAVTLIPLEGHVGEQALPLGPTQIRRPDGTIAWSLPYTVTSISADLRYAVTTGKRIVQQGLHKPVAKLEGTCGFEGDALWCKQGRSWMPIARNSWERGEPVEQAPAPPAPETGWQPDPPSGLRSITGTIVDGSGAPVPDTDVWLVRHGPRSRRLPGALRFLEGNRAMRRERTGPDGRFHFDGLDATVDWSVQARSWRGHAEADGLVPEARDVELELMLNPKQRMPIDLLVVDTDGEPLTEGFFVTRDLSVPLDGRPFWPPALHGSILGASGVLDEAVSIEPSGLQARVVVQDGEPIRCSVTSQGGLPLLPETRCIDLPPERQDLVDTLWKATSSGFETALANQHTILLPDGSAPARLQLFDAQGVKQSSTSTGLAAGTYTATGTKSGPRVPIGDAEVFTGTVELADGVHTVTIEPTYQGPVPTERIQIVDSDGTPVPWAPCGVKSDWLPQGRSLRYTDLDGWVEVPAFRDGHIEVWIASHRGASDQASASPQPEPLPPFTTGGASPDPLAHVRGSWVRDDGRAVLEVTENRWQDDEGVAIALPTGIGAWQTPQRMLHVYWMVTPDTMVVHDNLQRPWVFHRKGSVRANRAR